MQKAFNIFVVIALVAFGILLFLMWRSVRRLEGVLTAMAVANANNNNASNQSTQRSSVTGGEFFDELQKSAENMTIQMQFKK